MLECELQWLTKDQYQYGMQVRNQAILPLTCICYPSFKLGSHTSHFTRGGRRISTADT